MGFIKNKGFTLIELLIVTAILGVIAAALIATINPFEQVKKSIDASTKNGAVEFMDANTRFFATHNKTPWDASPTCRLEIGTGNTLDNTPSCVTELVSDGELKQGFTNSETLLSKIHINLCNDNPVICFNPQSKSQNNDPNAKFDENGNYKVGCPSTDVSNKCYWCTESSQCQVAGGGGGGGGGSGGGIIFTPTPTSMPTPTASPTPALNLGVGPYALDDTKFLRTYAVLSYNYPNFAPNYMIDISFRPDFGGTTSLGFGYSVNGVQVTSSADTILWVAYAGDGNFGTSTSPSYAEQIKLTSKHFAFISLPYYWSKYANGCGKTIYWRLSDFRNGGTGYTSTQFSQTYSGIVDCATTVGVWAGIYWPPIDLNGDGIINWGDYIIASLQTKLRAGGWAPPE